MKKKEFSNGSLCNLHLRAAGEGEEKSRVIEGTAIDALDRIDRGDVRSMSFGMWVDMYAEGNVTYEKLNERSADNKEVWIRHINKIDGLFDVTICHRPAYPDTEVEVRSANDSIEEIVKKELDKKQEEEFEAEQMQLRHQLFMMQQFQY